MTIPVAPPPAPVAAQPLENALDSRATAEAVHENPTVVMQMPGTLHCTVGRLQGHRFPLPPEGLWIGREAGAADIAVPESSISKKHVWIGPRDGVVMLVDETSTNGTFVNSVSAGRVRQRALAGGDRIILVSETLCVFEYRS